MKIVEVAVASLGAITSSDSVEDQATFEAIFIKLLGIIIGAIATIIMTFSEDEKVSNFYKRNFVLCNYKKVQQI